ncbi:MAG: RIP metalloprotease RseP [Clostridia bacterium]|nr:RIP metalloprotease RseP [Clostridia bacterium]
MGIIAIIVALLVFTILIVVHEFGHFLAARKCGVPVEEFSIGMGPAIFKKQGKNTLFSIRCLPIGGYCKMTGEEEASDVPDAFCNKNVWQRILIVVAGALFNIIFAFLVLMILPNFTKTATQYVNKVDENSPAFVAGIKEGDKIAGINGKEYPIVDDIMFELTVAKAEDNKITLNLLHEDGTKEDVELEYKPTLLITDVEFETEVLKVGTRITSINGKSIDEISDIKKEIKHKDDDKDVNEDIYAVPSEELDEVDEDIIMNDVVVTLYGSDEEYTLNDDEIEIVKNNSANRTNFLGVNLVYKHLNVWESIVYGVHKTRYYVTTTYKSFALMFGRKVSKDQIAGPVGIIKMFGDSYQTGIVEGIGVAIYNLLSVAAMISINLGVINLLPLPALDGGRFVILLVEVVRRKPMDLEKESWVHFVGFVLLMILMVLILFNDVTNIIA